MQISLYQPAKVAIQKSIATKPYRNRFSCRWVYYERTHAIVRRKYVYSYHEERGDFNAWVSDAFNRTIYHFTGYDMFEDGWMKHAKDVQGLRRYLVSLGFLPKNARLVLED